MDLTFLQMILDPWLTFLSDDPMLRIMQVSMISLGALVIFFVFFTTKDILQRTNSFLYMFISIIIAAVLPIVGFLIYLLIRPNRTLKEKEIEVMLKEILKGNNAKPPKKHSEDKKHLEEPIKKKVKSVKK